MTREKAIDRITKAARTAGFKVEENSPYMGFVTIWDDDRDVNFWWKMNTHWDVANGTITESPRLSAAVARMGGNPTVDELLKTADTVRRAAHLVQQVNSWELCYTVTIVE